MKPVPDLNKGKPHRWKEDAERSKKEIIDWLVTASSGGIDREDLERKATHAIDLLESTLDVGNALKTDPRILPFLRALTRRNIGTSQLATFIGIGEAQVTNCEAGRPVHQEIIENITALLELEIDYRVLPWLEASRPPTKDEKKRAVVIAADRILCRSNSTELRYKHEPRQINKLKIFLNNQGMQEIKISKLIDPVRDIKPGTYCCHASVEGLTSENKVLKQTVDILIKPSHAQSTDFPIFIEAKSMADAANPNKRQKEEAHKLDHLQRRWVKDSEHPIFFILLLGGIVPIRYLEVEAGSGLDWIWEHRIEDLESLIQWYLP